MGGPPYPAKFGRVQGGGETRVKLLMSKFKLHIDIDINSTRQSQPVPEFAGKRVQCGLSYDDLGLQTLITEKWTPLAGSEIMKKY